MEYAVVPTGPDFSPTMPNLVRFAAREYGSREFLISRDQRVSFADAERQSGTIARILLGLGMSKGSRVGLLLPNCADWVLYFLGIARSGAHCVALSTFYKARELEWALRFNDVECMILSGRYLKNDYIEYLERAIPELQAATKPVLYLKSHPFLRRIIVLGECDRPWAMSAKPDFQQVLADSRLVDSSFLEEVERQICPADTLITINTSGSTAEPKAVVHTHGAVVRATHSFVDYIDISREDRSYTGQPLFWVGGLNMSLLPSMHVGAAMCFADSPSPSSVVDTLERERVTRVSLWPSQADAVRAYAQDNGVDLSSVRLGLGVPIDDDGRVIPADRRAGGILGMSETFGMHSLERKTALMPIGKQGSWGRALPGIERVIIDRATGQAVQPGVCGALFVRGYTLMRGYHRKEREHVFTKDGYFDTGDIAAIDADGYLWFFGRESEMIKTSGANVSPGEVEAVLNTMDGVAASFVFGLPSSTKGQRVIAVVCPSDGVALDADTIRSGISTELSGYKVPEVVVVMNDSEVPRASSEKVALVQLKEKVADLIGSEGS